MVNIPEIVQKTDTYDIWRQKTNQAFDSLSVIADYIEGSLTLEEQFKFVASPLVQSIKISGGKVRDRNAVETVAQTDVLVDDGFVESFTIIPPIDTYNLSFDVVDNDPDVAVFVDDVLYTGSYTIDGTADSITFSPIPTGTNCVVMKNNKQIIAINANGLSSVVESYYDNTIPFTNTIPLYTVMSLEYTGFTGQTLSIFNNYLQNGGKVSAVFLNGSPLEENVDYVLSVTGIITLNTTLLLTDVVNVYGVLEDVRTWAVAAIDADMPDNASSFEWAVVVAGSPTSIITTTIPDSYIGNIGVYVDGFRKSSAVGVAEYTVGSTLAGFIELTFVDPIAVDSTVLVVVNEDAHQISTNPIVIEYPASITPEDTFDFSGDFTVEELSIYPSMERFLAVYVGGVRQSYTTFTIIERNKIVLDSPVVNTDVMFVVNEPNGLDGIAALIEGGDDGDILYRTATSVRWGKPEFDASAVISGTLDAGVLPVATPKEAFDAIVNDKVLTPARSALQRYREIFSNWNVSEVGSYEDYYLTNFSSFPDDSGRHYIATKGGRIFRGITGNNGFEPAYWQNAPFSGVNAIAKTHDDYGFSYRSVVVVGDKGKISIWGGDTYPKWVNYTVEDFPTIGIDNTWNCIQVESFLRNAGGSGHSYAIVFENSTKTAWKMCVFNVGFVGLPDNTVTLVYDRTLENAPTSKPVVKSYIYKNVAGRNNSWRIDWFVGNISKYCKDSYVPVVSNTITTAINGQKVIDFVIWNTSNALGGAITPNGESAGANGSGITYGALLTDNGTVVITSQSNTNSNPWHVSGDVIFSNATIDASFVQVCPSPLELNFQYDTLTNSELGRRIIAASQNNFSATTTNDANETAFNVKSFGSQFELPVRKLASPAHSQLFNGATDFYPTIIQNELADIASVIAVEGQSKTTNHSVAIAGITKAFTSENSPAPPIAISKVVSNGNVTIALAKAPINSIWIQTETNYGGVVIPFTDEIIDIFCEGQTDYLSFAPNAFFIVTATDVYYSLDGFEWKSTPHGITIGTGNGVYNASCAVDSTNSPTVVAHYVFLIDGKITHSPNNTWATFDLEPFVALGIGTYTEITADVQAQKLFLIKSTDSDLYNISYSDIGLLTPTVNVEKTGTFIALQFSDVLGGTIAIENNGDVWFLDSINLSVVWVLNVLTVNGSTIANLGSGIQKLTGRFALVARFSDDTMLVSANGKDWVRVEMPANTKNSLGEVTHNGAYAYFISESNLNNPTGKLPSYYKVVV